MNVPLQSFDLRRPVDLPVGDYEAMEKLLAAEEKLDMDRNAWKTKKWSKAEDFGWNNWEKASLTYFRSGAHLSHYCRLGCSRNILLGCNKREKVPLTYFIRLRPQYAILASGAAADLPTAHEDSSGQSPFCLIWLAWAARTTVCGKFKLHQVAAMFGRSILWSWSGQC